MHILSSSFFSINFLLWIYIYIYPFSLLIFSLFFFLIVVSKVYVVRNGVK